MVLGLSILNYGTKLETAISSSFTNKESGSTAAHQLNGMDLRILTITILLSLVFLCRALIDSLFAWNILKTHLQSPYIDLILIIFTELAPSLIITQIMKRNPETQRFTETEETQRSPKKYRCNASARHPIRSPH